MNLVSNQINKIELKPNSLVAECRNQFQQIHKDEIEDQAELNKAIHAPIERLSLFGFALIQLAEIRQQIRKERTPINVNKLIRLHQFHFSLFLFHSRSIPEWNQTENEMMADCLHNSCYNNSILKISGLMLPFQFSIPTSAIKSIQTEEIQFNCLI